MMAALRSPRMRKMMEAVEMDGGEMAMQSVHPRENQHAPVSCVISDSRRMRRIGQLRAMTPILSRARSHAQPTAVMAMHTRTQVAFETPIRSSAW